MSLIVDDSVRALNNKLPPDERESAHIIIEHSGPPPDAYQVKYYSPPRSPVLMRRNLRAKLIPQRHLSRTARWRPCWLCTTLSRRQKQKIRLVS